MGDLCVNLSNPKFVKITEVVTAFYLAFLICMVLVIAKDYSLQLDTELYFAEH